MDEITLPRLKSAVNRGKVGGYRLHTVGPTNIEYITYQNVELLEFREYLLNGVPGTSDE